MFETPPEERLMAEYRDDAKFIHSELQRLNSNVEKFFELYLAQSREVANLKTEVAVIKAKAATIGLVAGGFATGAVQFVQYLLK